MSHPSNTPTAHKPYVPDDAPMPEFTASALILGAVLAGGGATRFGSDKALVEIGGRTLIATAVDTLSAWCEAVVVAGREVAPAPEARHRRREGLDGHRRDRTDPRHGLQAGGHLAPCGLEAQCALEPRDLLGTGGDLVEVHPADLAHCRRQHRGRSLHRLLQSL